MTHFMKRCLLLVLTFALVFGICACDNGKNDPTEPTVDVAALSEAARNTIAITIGEHNVNAVELNYYYIETINSFCNNYYYYIYYYGMIDGNKPLNTQKCTLDESKTWSEYFLDVSTDNMKSTYLLYDLAVANGHTLSETDKKNLESLKESIAYYATYYKFATVDEYLVDIFGYGADLDSYVKYYEKLMLADSYYSVYADSLEYTEEQIRDFDNKSKTEFNSYTYAFYTLSTSKFLSGGTEGSDGKVTYTEEQQAAAVEAAKEAANALLGNTCANVNEFKDLILGMDINANLDSVSVTEKTEVLSSTIDELYKEWITSEERQPGDVTVVAKTSTGSDKKEVVDGYYILWYGGLNDNIFALKNVRHLLVMFKNSAGKTYSDGITSFTDAEKAATKADMDKIVALWEAGEMTEDAFAALANKHSQDGDGTSGGLYTEIYPGQMVTSFENWCYDAARQVGDYEVIETEYGYHLMYFVGDADITYRDYMITYKMRNEDLTKWHDSVMASAELTQVCLDYCELDMLLFS